MHRMRALFGAAVLIASFAGRNASLFSARDAALYVIYIDPASSRVALRTIGRDVTAPVLVSPDAADARGENGPALTQLEDGTLVAVYTASNELRVQTSRDRGRTWSAPRAVNDDRAARSHQFASIAARGEEAVVSWLDNRAGQQGVQTATLTRTSVSKTATADAKTCQCCRTALFTASDGTIFLAYRDLADGKVRNIAYAVSRDGGKTFSEPRDVADDHWSVDGCPESGPRFAEGRDHIVRIVWMNGGANAIELAEWRGNAFTKQQVVVARPGVNHPDVGVLADGRLAVVYETVHGSDRAIEARIGSETRTIAANGAFPRVANGRVAYTTFAGGEPRIAIAELR